MNAARYIPRPGTYAANAIAALRAIGPGKSMTSAELAARIDCDLTSLRNLLENAVGAGLIEMARIGPVNVYSIGRDPDDEPGPPAGRSVFEMGQPVKIPAPVKASGPRPGARFAVWSDGEIAIEREGRTTERITPDEARDLARVIKGKVYDDSEGFT